MTADLHSAGDALDLSAEDLASIRETWNGDTAEGAAAFGTTESAAAFTSLREALSTVLSGGTTDLGQHRDASHDGAGAYDGTEDGHGEQFGVLA